MRLRASSIILAAVGAVVGLGATTAVAGPKPAKPATPACGCHAAAHHVRRHAVRTHAHAARHAWKRMVAVHGGERMHGWHDEHGWSEVHNWSDGDERVDYRWEQRPWATDEFGFLTWPGKTHFVHPADGGPPPGADNSMPPPPPPGPPPGWRDGPSGPPQDEDGYDVYRF